MGLEASPPDLMAPWTTWRHTPWLLIRKFQILNLQKDGHINGAGYRGGGGELIIWRGLRCSSQKRFLCLARALVVNHCGSYHPADGRRRGLRTTRSLLRGNRPSAFAHDDWSIYRGTQRRASLLSWSYENGRVTIQPLQLEIEDDERDLTDFNQLHDPEAGVAVMKWNKEKSTLLHFVAGSELATFLEIPTAPLGLGSFDCLEKMPLKIASSDGSTADPP